LGDCKGSPYDDLAVKVGASLAVVRFVPVKKKGTQLFLGLRPFFYKPIFLEFVNFGAD